MFFHRLGLGSWLAVSLLAQPKPAPVKRPGIAGPGVHRPIASLTPDAVFQTGGNPDWIVIDEDVWVSNYPANNVARLDPKTNKVAAQIPVGKGPCSGIAAGFGSIWVPNCGDQTVSRIDRKTGQVTATFAIPIAHSEGGVAVSADSFWILTDKKGVLARVDPADNKVVAEVRVPPGSFAVAFGEGALWVTSTETNQLARVNPQTNVVEQVIPVGKKPRFLTTGFGSVWTLNQETGDVTRVDAKTNKVVAAIPVGVPGPGGEIAAGEGALWVTSFEFPLSKIDPEQNKVVRQYAGPGGDAVRVGLGSIWLSNLREGNLWRVHPRLD